MFSLISKRLDNLPITPQMIFIVAGMLLGSGFLGVVNLNSDPGIVLFIAEITLVLVLFSDASKININDLRKNNLTLRLLSIGLSLTIISGIVVATLLLT
ncbi:MAG: cation:proton antiporter, partial [Methanobacteriaceae archaeon]|nr:cation:proton antiporter [Methanobacteriaceae archaeon]